MRSIILIALLSVFSGGCASRISTVQWKKEAASLGIAQEEVAAIAHQASEHHKLVVLWFEKRADGAIAVYMADKPERPHGIVVVVRKVDVSWQEDTKSLDNWIK